MEGWAKFFESSSLRRRHVLRHRDTLGLPPGVFGGGLRMPPLVHDSCLAWASFCFGFHSAHLHGRRKSSDPPTGAPPRNAASRKCWPKALAWDAAAGRRPARIKEKHDDRSRASKSLSARETR